MRYNIRDPARLKPPLSHLAFWYERVVQFTHTLSLKLTSTTMDGVLQGTQKAVKWYPPAFDVRVEEVPIPT